MVFKIDKKKKTGADKTGVNAQKSEPVVKADTQQNTGANRTYMLIGAIVVVLLIAASLWQLGFFTGAATKPVVTANNTTVVVDKLSMPQAKLLSEYINKIQNIPTIYQVTYVESVDNISRELTASSDGVWIQVKTQTPLYTRSYFWSVNQTILCENNGESTACGSLNETDELIVEAQQMGGMTFPEANQSERILAAYQKLINNSEFRFVGDAKEKSIAGRTCQAIAYSLGENNLSVCLDNQYGVVLSQEMTYNQPYQQTGSTQILYRTAEYKIEAKEMGFAALSITAPVVENSTKAIEMATTDDAEWLAMQECQYIDAGDEQRRCFKDNAISFNDVRFCEQNLNATAMGDCVIKVATQPSQLRPELCEKAGEMKPECYANIAYLKNDASYCNLVSDEKLRTACDEALKNATISQ